jgi:uncharacterized membrane protein
MARDRLDQPATPRRGLRGPSLDPDAFGNLSERIARFIGTGRFLVYMTVVVAVWLLWNSLAPPAARFDPYPFIFLTLVLSLQASYAAPLILLAQNRQDDRDRVSFQADREVAAQYRADMEFLAREIASLRLAVGDLATREFIRTELRELSEGIVEEFEELTEEEPARP